jgi:putative Mg2+ transporter-C (MgtC) family protein
LVSAFGFTAFTAAPSTTAVRADVTRISSQIVVGIGFLGGGTILRQGANVRGLTTAASLWVTAAVGLAVAMGFYVGALMTGGLVLLALTLKPVERWLARARKRGEADADAE